MMTEPNNTQNQTAPQIASLKRRSWPVGERERRLLPLSLALGYLAVSLLMDWRGAACRAWG